MTATCSDWYPQNACNVTVLRGKVWLGPYFGNFCGKPHSDLGLPLIVFTGQSPDYNRGHNKCYKMGC